jgi:hypothetical protein
MILAACSPVPARFDATVSVEISDGMVVAEERIVGPSERRRLCECIAHGTGQREDETGRPLARHAGRMTQLHLDTSLDAECP